jgi:choloylglycine hydrolase
MQIAQRKVYQDSEARDMSLQPLWNSAAAGKTSIPFRRRMRICLRAICIIACVFISFAPSHACTAFFLNDSHRMVVGKNYDWTFDEGVVIENKRGAAKSAFYMAHPLQWVSHYGSLTFNQYGQDIPCGGMNEKGLVIEVLWFQDAEYPFSDSLPQIDNMQWIQYQLDVSSSIDEIIAHDSAVTMRPMTAAAVHYFAADAQGRSCIIEYINAERHYYISDSAHPPILTNDAYARCVSLLSVSREFGGNQDIARGQGSVARFIKGAAALNKKGEQHDDPISFAENVLHRTWWPMVTKWSIMYDLGSLSIRFKTASNKKMRIISLKSFDFDCSTPIHYYDLESKGNGDITGMFHICDVEDNQRVIRSSFKKTEFLKGFSQDFLEQLADYPGTFKCDTAQ